MLRGREQRLLHRILGSGEVAVPAREHTENLRRCLAQQVLDAHGDVQRSPPACSSHASISATSLGASSMTWRTWIGCSSGMPPGPGTAESLAAISIARASD